MPEHIERIRIPDDDMPGWIQTLREGGFADEEIDTILSRLNETYARAKGINPVEEELERIESYLQATYGRTLTGQQREYLRKSIEQRPEFKDFRK